MLAVLELSGITKAYGHNPVLMDASLAVKAGEIHALMGENGAGKSTLARIIAGVARPDQGVMRFGGKPVHFADAIDAQRAGIAIIHQELDLFEHLTVSENIVIGNLRFADNCIVDRPRASAFSRQFIERVGLDLDPGTLLGRLPIAHQQLVAIARALSMDCRLLVMDEPTSALPESACEALFDVISALRDDGVAIVYVSHKLDEIFRLCNNATVLRDGVCIATCAIAETDREHLIQLMVGRAVDLSARHVPQGTGNVRLSVTGLANARLRDLSFDLFEGEVLGIAGLVGAGRSELGCALVGLDPITSGTIELDGAAYAPESAAQAQRRGVVLLPEDRKFQGLMPQMSVAENAILAIASATAWNGFITKARNRAMLQPLWDQLSIKSASPDAPISTLSGGNQQKVLLARWLLTSPKVIFLDDPTRGVDVGAKADIHAMIHRLAASGCAVLLASSELPELLRCCDRIMVLNQGCLAGLFNAGEATQEAIMAAATAAPVAKALSVPAGEPE